MSYKLGITGATGITGEITLRILRERAFPVGELRLFGSRRSEGRRIGWDSGEVTVEALEDGHFGGLDLVINATPSSVAREWVPRMADEVPLVVDQSSAMRMDPDVPIVVPEVNPEAAKTHKGVIAGPNCTTTVPLMAVAPLHRAVEVRSLISSSYQSISGVGRDGISEFIEHSRKAADQVEALKGYEELNLPAPEWFPREIAFNLFPQCETFPAGRDFSTEEEKMQPEMRKILDAPDLLVHATAVRVPVLVGHSVSLTLSLGQDMSPDDAREVLADFAGVEVRDEPWMGNYPTPLDAAGIDEILVGRVRANPLVPNGLSLFACGDNLRKGNALNAVQVAELVLGIG
jgi:aspartate-semialdehyde dehydrogenase